MSGKRRPIQNKVPNKLQPFGWGSDAGDRVFGILVDGARVAAQTLQRNAPNRLFVIEHATPTELTRGKKSVTVRFRPAPNGKLAGGVFGLSTLRKEIAQ